MPCCIYRYRMQFSSCNCQLCRIALTKTSQDDTSSITSLLSHFHVNHSLILLIVLLMPRWPEVRSKWQALWSSCSVIWTWTFMLCVMDDVKYGHVIIISWVAFGIAATLVTLTWAHYGFVMAGSWHIVNLITWFSELWTDVSRPRVRWHPAASYIYGPNFLFTHQTRAITVINCHHSLWCFHWSTMPIGPHYPLMTSLSDSTHALCPIGLIVHFI